MDGALQDAVFPPQECHEPGSGDASLALHTQPGWRGGILRFLPGIWQLPHLFFCNPPWAVRVLL